MDSSDPMSGQNSRSNDLSDCIQQFNELTQNVDSFLSCDSKKSQKFVDLTKSLYDLNKRLINGSICKDSSVLSIKSSLDELFTTGFDDEQIWQQIQLNNEPLLELLVKDVAKVSAEGSHFLSTVESTETKTKDKNISKKTNDESFEIDEQMSEVSDNLMSEESDDDLPEESEEEFDNKKNMADNTKKQKKVRILEPKRKSIVDDKFFKLCELEEFLNSEDIREQKKISGEKAEISDESEDDINLFDNISEISGDEDLEDGLNGKEAMFSDFFDDPIDDQQNGNRKESESSDEELDEVNDKIDTRDVDFSHINDNESGINLEDYSSDGSEDSFVNKRQKDISDENKSEFERISESLKEKIEKQERLNLMPKSWQMSGEVVSDKRPENSLLEEHLHFDHTTRPPPLITEETTVKLEDIIKQRVKDNAFDDVVRKVKPKEKPFEYKRRITLESEKSKQSLSQIYENEFIRQQQKEAETQQNPIHTQIKKLMRNLFVRLDALSNFNFTPRPPQPEVKVINNLPAITAEEVTPVTVSDVALLAPQEVFNNQKRELQSNAEKSETDRKRSRRLKKKIQSKKAVYNKSKQIKNKDKEQNKSWSETKHLSSSKKFFQKLEEKKSEIPKKNKFEKKDSIKESNKLKL